MTHGLKVVALLPMKGNSQRVRGKNFRPLADKPLYRWILDTLLSIEAIQNVIINTDAAEKLIAAELPKDAKIILRDRDMSLCGDEVSMNLILANDVGAVPADIYVMTHATNPILSREVIEAALTKFITHLKANTADSLFTVNKIQTRFYKKNGMAINHDPNNLIQTQDLEPWFEENSCLYIFTKESFEQTKARIGKAPILFETPKYESIDIDTEEDWQIADAIANQIVDSRRN